MKENKTLFRRVGEFLAGKGFYIVLFVCVVIIGVSAWALFLTNDTAEVTDVDVYPGLTTPVFAAPTPDTADTYTVVSPTPTLKPQKEIPTPAPTPVPAPTATPAPTPKQTAAPAETTQREDSAETSSAAKSIDDISFIRPAAGDVKKEYSVDVLLYNRTLGDWRTHMGVDIAGAIGTKVQSAADGTVTSIVNDDMLGTIVVIDHGFGLESVYANLAAEPVLKVGDKVSQGAVVGAIGDTALSETGEAAHLHFEMKLNGENVNPEDYLP